MIVVDDDAAVSVRTGTGKGLRNTDPLGLAIAMTADLLFRIEVIREQMLVSRCFPVSDDIAPGVAIQFRMAIIGMVMKRCRNMPRQDTTSPATFQIMVVCHSLPWR